MKKTGIALALAAAGVIGLATFDYKIHPALMEAQAAPVVQGNLGKVEAPLRAMPDFASIAQQFGPAVVNIAVSGSRKTGMGGAQDEEGGFGGLPPELFRGLPFRASTAPSRSRVSRPGR